MRRCSVIPMASSSSSHCHSYTHHTHLPMHTRIVAHTLNVIGEQLHCATFVVVANVFFVVYYIQFQYYLMRFWRFLYVSCSEAPAPHTHTQSCRRPASMQFCYISMHFGWHTGSGVWNITASQKRIVDAHQHTQSERWIEM